VSSLGRLAITTLVAGLALALAPAASHAAVRAGAAEVDASWHVGASAGQYASDGTFVSDHGVDPNSHSYRRASSYGRQSELKVRAIVVQGADGRKVAIVKNDLYLPGDLLHRRTAQLLEAGDSGVTRETLTMAVTHNHSSPYYSSPSAGVWTFQDVFDVRFYDYYARKQAEAVEKAAANMVPVRVGASVNQFDKSHRHSFGPATADDGTPAGYPQSDTDHDMVVVRFDDISDPDRPKPLANLVNFPLHPEFLDGNDLITADYLAPLQRMADRQTKALTILTQGSVGTAEPERSTYHSIHERLEFSHKEYAQAEYAARLMADSIVDAWSDVGRGDASQSGDPGRFVPFATDFPVAMKDKWYPGPFSHPYPGVSNCRTDQTLAGDPNIPVVGLPDCASPGDNPVFDGPDDPLGPANPGLNTDDFQRLGVPVPENYSAPSYGALEEDLNIHLQAFRLGEILFTVCSCEQWKDQGTNIKTRTDTVAGNQYNGYDWVAEGADVSDLPADRVERMRAQVNNPANGWNDLENAATAESEPTDPAQIKGNFTHDDDQRSAQLGYRLTVAIGMANDYNGYIASYREYQRGDHYRKALTAWGPHSADYMATRLVTLGRLLKDPAHELPRDQTQEDQLDHGRIAADNAFNDLRAEALGAVGAAAIAAYEARLPDDGGEARAVHEPSDQERFGVALFTWNGGSNFTDSPDVRVQRRVGGQWEDYADGSGELPVTLKFPQGTEVPAHETGSYEWEWTAHFEPFVSRFDLGDRPRATPAGDYRFVARGHRRENRAKVPYEVVSRTFAVRPWSGISAEDVRVEDDGRVSLRVGPRSTHAVSGSGSGQAGGADMSDEVGPIDYPDSYESPARFIDPAREFYRDPAAPDDPDKLEWFCFACSWRPWADAGDADTVALTFTGPAGSETVPARREGGRWVSDRVLADGEAAYVGAGCVKDEFGNFNGAASAVVGAAGIQPQTTCSTAPPGDGGGEGGGAGGGFTGPGAHPAPTRRTPAQSTRCLPRRLGVRRGRIGPVSLGASLRGLQRGYRVARRGRVVTRFCVRGGGRFLVGASGDRIDFVGSTSRGHSTRQTAPGRRLGRSRGARRVRRGVLVGTLPGNGRVVYGHRRGRTAFVAVVPPRAAARPRALVRRLRAIGLVASRS
jgi:hypothetical protein